MQPLGRLVSIAELAALTSMCDSTWRKRIARGQVPVVRIGRSVRVAEHVVEEILARGLKKSEAVASS